MSDCFGLIMITLQCTRAAAVNPNLGKWQSSSVGLAFSAYALAVNVCH
jgi:hypothetical protein